eukprot:g4978.t1
MDETELKEVSLTPSLVKMINDKANTIVDHILPPANDYMNNHVPIHVPEKHFVFCLTPKVGSLYVRSVVDSFKRKKKFRLLNLGVRRTFHKHLLKQHSLFSSTLEQERKIAFTRDPVFRTLSGFIHVYSDVTPEDFKLFVFGKSPNSFQTLYTDKCDKSAIDLSLHPLHQHYTPSQHCRCGMEYFDYEMYKIEELSPRTILKQFFSEKFLGAKDAIYHKKKYDKAKFLTPKVLSKILEITAKERKILGYNTTEKEILSTLIREL